MTDDQLVLERVQELTWALVDDEITADEMTLLDSLLLSDEKARKHYIDCMQLHADLMVHYTAKASTGGAAGTAKSPVLGFLHAGTPPLGYDLPPAEETK